MARWAVLARVVAGGMDLRAALTIEGVAPLHAARTSQRDVPTTLNRYWRPRQPLFKRGMGHRLVTRRALVPTGEGAGRQRPGRARSPFLLHGCGQAHDHGIY